MWKNEKNLLFHLVRIPTPRSSEPLIQLWLGVLSLEMTLPSQLWCHLFRQRFHCFDKFLESFQIERDKVRQFLGNKFKKCVSNKILDEIFDSIRLRWNKLHKWIPICDGRTFLPFHSSPKMRLTYRMQVVTSS